MCFMVMVDYITDIQLRQCVHNIYLIEGVIAESGYYRSFSNIGRARCDQGDGGAVVGPRHLAPPVY